MVRQYVDKVLESAVQTFLSQTRHVTYQAILGQKRRRLFLVRLNEITGYLRRQFCVAYCNVGYLYTHSIAL